MKRNATTDLGRRALIKGGTLLLVAGALNPMRAAESLAQAAAKAASETAPSTQPAGPLRIGLITDLHYADKPSVGTRFYREVPAKLAEAGEAFKRAGASTVVCVGDLIDSAATLEAERGHLATINRQLASIADDRHYVLGNHCVDGLTKEEFLADVGQAKSYGSFDRGGVHFVLLDACFRVDGVPYGRRNAGWTDTFVPAEQLAWLAADLRATTLLTIVFVHQRLDERSDHAVRNAPAVRAVLEASGKVRTVFQGHHHINDLKEIAGVRYCTLMSMIDGSGPASNAYSLLEIAPTGAISVRGFRGQKSYDWPA
ncbi:MAG: metallophosphoesterase [Planctomycetota bacterium]|nr:metallophosphoesterase [Planctomycetota bacterium]